jgi:hypothetical protein
VRRLILRMILVFLLALPALARAQVAFEGQGAPISFTVGGSFSYFNANYAGNQLGGVTAFADISPFVFDHLGMETEGRWLLFNGSHSFREYNYLAGPKVRLPWGQHGPLHPYAKALAGQGIIDFPDHLAYGRYAIFAFGGGVDASVTRRWKIRADYEYQIWPNAPGIPGLSSPALKPNGVTLGASYRVF